MYRLNYIIKLYLLLNIDDVQSAVRDHIASKPDENGENLKVSVTHLHAHTHTHTKHFAAGCSPCFVYHI